MNPLVKKEIRLLLPGFLAILALEAFAPWFVKDLDFVFGFAPVIFFFGMIILAIDSFGREFSPGTFTLLMSQPVERQQIWRTKITVLLVAAALVFVAYFASCGVRLHLALTDNYSIWHVNPKIIGDDFHNSMIASVAVMLAALTGGLWTSLLLRQISAAFWISLLIPIGLLFLIAFVGDKFFNSASMVIVSDVLYGAAGIYSIAGFLLAHRLFHRAQDAAWTGGVINFSKWRYFDAGAESSISVRRQRPLSALLKKEFQLHSIGLIGAGALVVVHLAVRALYANSNRNSTAGLAAASVWVLWLVMPLMIGCMAVAEERKLGVTEAQLCLPVSRRFQFATKFIPVMIFGVLLGGIMPQLLEMVASHFGVPSEFFKPENHAGNQFGIPGITLFEISIVALAAGFALAGFFASTLAKNFLQALSIAIVIIIGSCLFAAFLFAGSNGNGQMEPWGMKLWGVFLPLVIGILTAILFIPWLAYRNFSRPVEGGRLWRRNILAFVGAVLFIFASSAAIYNRVWEVFEPAEPAHGMAKLTLANPPTLKIARGYNLLVRLPDGRVWFDGLGDSPYENYYYRGSIGWKYLWQMLAHPMPESLGPKQFLVGSNWVAATTAHMYFGWNNSGKDFRTNDFMETVGIQPDGTLWITEKPETNKWTPGTLQQFGSDTNWKQLAQGSTSVVLLKNDGTLWRWGWLTNELHHWPGLRTLTPYQIGTNANWQELVTWGGMFARQTNGSVWQLDVDWKTGRDKFERATNFDEIALQTASCVGENDAAFVRADGTLWLLNRYWDRESRQTLGTGILQVGKENGWRAVAVNSMMMVALKADGSLWQWQFMDGNIVRAANNTPTRLGIHDDWVAITGRWSSVIALAADGSLWLWPDKEYFDYQILIKLPKQPQLLGNVFGKAN